MASKIEKQIEACKKRIDKYQASIQRYSNIVDKNIALLNKKGYNVTRDEFYEAPNPTCANFHGFKTDRKDLDYELMYKVTDALEYMYTNTYYLKKDQENLKKLYDEQNAKIDFDASVDKLRHSSLAEILRTQMTNFKEAWFTKMMNYYDRYWHYVDENKKASKEWYNKAKSIQDKYYFQLKAWNSPHWSLNNKIEEKKKQMSNIFNDIAARTPLKEYLENNKKQLEEDWENCIVKLVDKCQKYGIDENKVVSKGYDVTEKGFEAVLEDGKNRVIYARVIWAAEYSLYVTPHTRYIVTEKKIR